MDHCGSKTFINLVLMKVFYFIKTSSCSEKNVTMLQLMHNWFLWFFLFYVLVFNFFFVLLAPYVCFNILVKLR